MLSTREVDKAESNHIVRGGDGIGVGVEDWVGGNEVGVFDS